MILSTCDLVYKICQVEGNVSIYFHNLFIGTCFFKKKMRSQILLILFYSRSNGIPSLNSYDSFIIDDRMIPEKDPDDIMNMTSSKAGCKPGPGLQCGAKRVLDLGEQFLVSSRVCQGGEYPGGDMCRWSFDVSDECLPRLDCHYLDIIGNWRWG